MASPTKTQYFLISHIFRREEGEPNPFEDPVLKDIASKTGKSIAQVILRSHLQNGICVVPKSVTPARLKENLNVSSPNEPCHGKKDLCVVLIFVLRPLNTF